MTNVQLTPVINEWTEGSDYLGRSLNIAVEDIDRDLHVFRASLKRDSESIAKLPTTIYIRNSDGRYIRFGRFSVDVRDGLTITYKPDMLEQKRVRGCCVYTLIVDYI